jgi:8-oxo-dGTP pyrophosphatase MutT (NUDIX family)
MDERRAAVLVPLVVAPNGARRLILIQRGAAASEHAGQVAFPGGRHDGGRDESLLATALREASEEVGIEAAGVRVIGALPERRTFTSGRLVSPFVGVVASPIRLRRDRREVAAVFTAALDDFASGASRERLRWEVGGAGYEVPCVRIGKRVVWGLTLDVIDDLLAVIGRLLPP